MKISFETIVAYIESLGEKNTDIALSFRWNKAELTSKLRSGVTLPIMLIDSPEISSEDPNNKVFHYHSCAITILGKPNVDTSKLDGYAQQNEVLDYCQRICMDIADRIKFDGEQRLIDDQQNWLYNNVENGSFHYFKVGPIFANSLYGYRCEFTIKSKVNTVVDPAKWSDL